MKSRNRVELIGNVGQNPDVRATAAGNTVINLTVATDESYKDRSTGQLVSQTEWHKVVLFGKVAEALAPYLHKGSRLFIEGKLKTRKWEDKHGTSHYSTEIVVDLKGEVILLDSKPNNADQTQTHQSQSMSGHPRMPTDGHSAPPAGHNQDPYTYDMPNH